VHVTGWAVENMPDDDLRAFLLDPEVFNALLFGAVFTDTGYARDSSESHAYSEHTHWEPFIQDYLEWIAVNDPPPWTTMESKKRVAFLMGCASHGLQDSIFDSLFLHHIEEQDGAGQDEADPGTDGFLVMDEHIRFVPEQDIPMDMLLELYQELEADITEEVILDSVELTTDVYINDHGGTQIAAGMGALYEDDLTWTRTHYMDPSVPGSLRAEIFPTMKYQQAIWARLHGDYKADDATVFAYPEQPRRLISHDFTSTESWVALIFGAGVVYDGSLAELRGPDGGLVSFTQANNRWGAGHTRVIRLMPEADLVPGGWYTVHLREGLELIDGQTSTTPWEMSFQVECDAASAGDCEDLGDIPVASVDGIPEEEGSGPDSGAAVEEGGCGCDAVGRTAAWLPLVLLAVARRRVAHRGR